MFLCVSSLDENKHHTGSHESLQALGPTPERSRLTNRPIKVSSLPVVSSWPPAASHHHHRSALLQIPDSQLNTLTELCLLSQSRIQPPCTLY